MTKFKVGDKVVDNGKGYCWNEGLVGEVVGTQGKDNEYLSVSFGGVTFPYVEDELEHYDD